MNNKIPRAKEDDYRQAIVEERQKFIEENTPAQLTHSKQFSFEPADMAGNIENLFGVAQVPVGLAGPLLVDGEYADGNDGSQDERWSDFEANSHGSPDSSVGHNSVASRSWGQGQLSSTAVHCRV